MPCQQVKLPNGGFAIVCSRGRRQRCACGAPAEVLCDWKVAGKKSGTCDKPICVMCAKQPARGKDLCREHAEAWEHWKAERARA
jgi:hypothetical protein